MDDKQQQYRLTTFLGPDNIRLMPPQEFSCNILGVTLQDGPINLLCPDFNLTSAKLDSTTIEAEISSKIIKLATPSVLDHLFYQLCSGYSKEQHAALDHVRQTYEDTSGDTIFMSASDYCTEILAASRPFIDQEELPISICQAFMDGLDSHLLAGFAPFSLITASRRRAQPLTSARSSRRCSRQPSVLRWSIPTSGPSPVKPLAQVKHSPPK